MDLLVTLLLSLGFLVGPAPSAAPQVPLNQYGLPVVERAGVYRQEVLRERDASLVDLDLFVPGLRLDLAYATRDNPTGRVLYDDRKAYLRLPAARALRSAQRELARHGVGLVIYDAYRPYSATLALWQAVRDSAYAAPPTSGSRHNRGAAVDVGLVGLESGRALRMPTEYGTFSAAAHHGFAHLPAGVIARRKVLQGVMSRHGFTPLASEWWHYDFTGWRRFPLLDLPLSVVAGERPRLDVWSEYPLAARLVAPAFRP